MNQNHPKDIIVVKSCGKQSVSANTFTHTQKYNVWKYSQIQTDIATIYIKVSHLDGLRCLGSFRNCLSLSSS